MNTIDFNPHEKVIRVTTRIWGPKGSKIVLLLLDTGAEGCILNELVFTLIGYNPTSAPETMKLTTVSGSVEAPRFHVEKIRALDYELTDFPITCYTPPPRAGIDGILGMDFFLRRKLTIDFRIGLVTLE